MTRMAVRLTDTSSRDRMRIEIFDSGSKLFDIYIKEVNGKPRINMQQQDKKGQWQENGQDAIEIAKRVHAIIGRQRH